MNSSSIGFIIYGYPPEVIGGAELQAKKLALKLSKNHKVIVFAGSKSDEVINLNDSLKVIKIKWKNIKIMRIFLSQLVAFMPLIKKEAPELSVLICYQVNPAGIIGVVSKYLLKIPIIVWARGVKEYKSFFKKYTFTPFLLQYSDKFLVQSNRMKKELIDLYLNKPLLDGNKLKGIVVIPNGIDTYNGPILSYKERDGILYVGRLHKVKGIKYLIEATNGIDEKLLIVGNGPEETSLKRMSMGINVKFLGNLAQKEVIRFMSRTKLLVLPSLGEALPNVILEAMSVGTPVIATDVGSIPDVIEHGKTGFLLKPKDVDNLRKYILILLRDQRLWQEMHFNCMREAKKYSWERVVSEVENVIKAVL